MDGTVHKGFTANNGAFYDQPSGYSKGTYDLRIHSIDLTNIDPDAYAYCPSQDPTVTPV